MVESTCCKPAPGCCQPRFVLGPSSALFNPRLGIVVSSRSENIIIESVRLFISSLLMSLMLVVLATGLAYRLTDRYRDVPDEDKPLDQNLVVITMVNIGAALPGIFRWDMVLVILASVLSVSMYTLCSVRRDMDRLQLPRNAVGVPDMLLGISRVVSSRTFISYSWKGCRARHFEKTNDRYPNVHPDRHPDGHPAMGALALSRSLARALPSAWVDVQFMENAKLNPRTMKRAVEGSLSTVLLITPGYMYSRWCLLELMFAL